MPCGPLSVWIGRRDFRVDINELNEDRSLGQWWHLKKAKDHLFYCTFSCNSTLSKLHHMLCSLNWTKVHLWLHLKWTIYMYNIYDGDLAPPSPPMRGVCSASHYNGLLWGYVREWRGFVSTPLCELYVFRPWTCPPGSCASALPYHFNTPIMCISTYLDIQPW